MGELTAVRARLHACLVGLPADVGNDRRVVLVALVKLVSPVVSAWACSVSLLVSATVALRHCANLSSIAAAENPTMPAWGSIDFRVGGRVSRFNLVGLALHLCAWRSAGPRA